LGGRAEVAEMYRLDDQRIESHLSLVRILERLFLPIAETPPHAHWARLVFRTELCGFPTLGPNGANAPVKY
jgi:hypothetical protein